MKAFLKIVVMIFLWCNTATAESVLPPCQGEDHLQWTNCFGTFTFSTGETYVGEWKNGMSNGRGTDTWPDGGTYVGEFKDNLPNGQGTETWPDGQTYVGEWKDGRKNGQGNITFADGGTYVGEFKDDMKNGQGTYTYPDRETYVGEFKDDMRNGQGTYTWKDGVKFVGEFKDDMKNGQGTYTYPDGGTYVGEFKDDMRNGQGTETWNDGVKFVGEYKDGKRDGLGTMTWVNGDEEVAIFTDDELVKIISSTCPFSCEFGCIIGDCNGGLKVTDRTIGTYVYNNGDAYVGQWLNNKQDGKGVYIFSDRTTKEGIWSYGDLIHQCMEGNCINGKGLIKNNENGAVYFGDLKNYKANGEGVLTKPDGFKHTGEFKNNKRDGIGTSEYKNGAKYTGGFKDDKFHGQGTITYKGGDKQTGNYLNGEKDGVHKIILSDGTEYKKLYQYGKIEEYIFENETEKLIWLEKTTNKNKIKENAELKCVDSRNDAFSLKFDKKKNQIFFEIGEVEIDNVYVNFDMVLNYILRNNDRTILAFGSKSFTKNGITKSLIFRIELDKYTGDLLFSWDELGEKGFEVIKILNADSYNFRQKDKSICKKRILN